MRAYWALVRRELSSYFLSWTGYVVIAAVLLLLGSSFANLMAALNEEATDRPLTELFYSTYYFWLILLLGAPVITMRVFAQEKATGTFETLMTTPINELQVVLAKFTGAMIFYILMWLPLLACLGIVRVYAGEQAALDAGTVGATFLGIYLLGAVYVALGCFASSLTRSHLVAVMIGLAAGVSFFLLSFLSALFTATDGWKGRFFGYVDLIEHMKDFAAGVVDTRPVVLCLSLAVFFLFATVKVVESRRWK
jgi:ABC-2 type transport system permease protein